MYKLKQNISAEDMKLDSEAEKILKSKSINIQDGAYKLKPWDKIFKSLSRIQASSLSLCNDDSIHMVIVRRSPSTASSLQLLTILKCYTCLGIELYRLKRQPDFKLLTFNNQTFTNNITNVRALRKGFFPNLEELHFSSNPIIQPDCLSQLYLPKGKILRVQIQYFNTRRWPNLDLIGESKRWLFKLELTKHAQVYARSKDRRAETHIDNVLKTRYDKMEVS